MTRSTLDPDSGVPPGAAIADMQRLAAAHLSLPSRLGHTVLLVVSLTVATAIGSLWATEPALPARAHAGFAAVVGIALAWAAFAGWVLARRRVLFGADQVLAATMALAFTALGAVGFVAVGYWGGAGRAAYVGALVHAALFGVAAVLLVRARRRVDSLSRRRRELEQQLGRQG